jgi:hypothetical protein
MHQQQHSNMSSRFDTLPCSQSTEACWFAAGIDAGQSLSFSGMWAFLVMLNIFLFMAATTRHTSVFNQAKCHCPAADVAYHTLSVV